MSYILLMTSAGSMLFVGQLLVELGMRKRMSQTSRYRMLVIVLFTYLVPWVWMKGFYEDINLTLPAVGDRAIAVNGKGALGDAVFRAADKVVITPDYRSKLLVVSWWMGIAVLLMLVRCGVYFHNRHALLKCASRIAADLPEELALRLQREFGIKRRVRIVPVSGRKRNLTMGVIRPVIFLQETGRPDELEHILRHEFTHIARGDTLIKMLMQFVCCLHWFNPLVYWMSRRLERACEKSCDERVVRDMPEGEREDYARLMIQSMKQSGKKSRRKVLFVSFFASNDKFAEERVKAIMKNGKRRLWEKVVVAGAFAALVFADSLTALAYPQVYHVEEAPAQMAESFAQGEVMLVRGSIEHTEAHLDEAILYDQQVVTADGEIHPVQGQTRVLCFHKWEDAHVQTHVKDDNGGCTTEIYECKYCPKCDSIKIGDYVNTVTYAKCPHGN